MKHELKLTTESVHDELVIEAALRATDLLYALKEIRHSIKDRPKRDVIDAILNKLDLLHLILGQGDEVVSSKEA